MSMAQDRDSDDKEVFVVVMFGLARPSFCNTLNLNTYSLFLDPAYCAFALFTMEPYTQYGVSGLGVDEMTFSFLFSLLSRLFEVVPVVPLVLAVPIVLLSVNVLVVLVAPFVLA
jgi:hypothetical protein